jgi:hypothetical protein
MLYQLSYVRKFVVLRSSLDERIAWQTEADVYLTSYTRASRYLTERPQASGLGPQVRKSGEFLGPGSEPEARGLKPEAPVTLRYSVISVTTPAPTVRPPSRIANRRPASHAIGLISSMSRLMLSPGITISVPPGSVAIPVTSVVRK